MSTRNANVRSVFGLGMRHSVAVFIPSTVNVDQAVDTSAYVDQAIENLSNTFGGASAVSIVGGWVTEDGTIVKENVTRVYAYANRLTVKNLQALKDFAHKVRSELTQEAVLVEIDNEAFFITAD